MALITCPSLVVSPLGPSLEVIFKYTQNNSTAEEQRHPHGQQVNGESLNTTRRSRDTNQNPSEIHQLSPVRMATPRGHKVARAGGGHWRDSSPHTARAGGQIGRASMKSSVEGPQKTKAKALRPGPGSTAKGNEAVPVLMPASPIFHK